MVTTVTWKPNTDGDWSNTANWSSGALPTSGNSVTISTTNVHNITHSTGTDIIDKLTVGQDNFALTGGSLQILTTASFANGFSQNANASPSVLTAGAVTITGAASLLGGESEGATAFTVSGGTTIGNYTLGGSSVLNVATTADQTAGITLGDSTGVNARINITSGGTYEIAGDFGIGGVTSALVNNAGTFSKGSGAGTSAIGVSVNSTGTVSAASGNLQFSGATNTLSGSLSGAGQISFAGGFSTLSATSVTVSTLGLYGAATLNLGANLTYLHTFIDSSNNPNLLNLGAHNLTLGGSSASIVGNFGSANVTGSGAFTNKSTLTLARMDFGGTLALTNDGTIQQTDTVTIGDGGGGAPTFANASAGVYDFTTDSTLGQSGAVIHFVNQGLLEKTGVSTNGVSVVSVAVANSGTIAAQDGVFDFNNSLVDTGAINGSAEFEDDGFVALNTGATMGVARFDLYDRATLQLGTSIVYAGVFVDSSNGNNQIALGSHNLRLTGASNSIVGNYGSADINGTGMLENAGTLTLANAIVDGQSEIDNTGTINQSNNITIGGGGGQVASIVNAKAATYNLSGGFTISEGAAASSHFDNSGTFVATTGLGIGTLATTFNNLTGGVLNVASGELLNTGIVVNAGTISGTRFIDQNGGVTYLNSGTVLSVGEFDMYGASALALRISLTYTGTFIDASNGSTTINLANHTLALKGADVEFSPAFGNCNITGAGGALKLESATTLLEGGTTVIGGTAGVEFAAKAVVTGGLQIGDGSSNAASGVIDTKGVYDFTADANGFGIGRGASAASTFTNNGLFEKTAGGGTNVVSVAFVNNGTIKVTSGTIEFLSGTLTNNGAIIGTETTDGNGNVFIKAASAAAAGPNRKSAALAAHHLSQAMAALGPSAAATIVSPSAAQPGGGSPGLLAPVHRVEAHRIG